MLTVEKKPDVLSLTTGDDERDFILCCVPVPQSAEAPVGTTSAHRAADISVQQIASAVETLGWQLPGSVFIFGVFLGPILFESIVAEIAQEMARYLDESASLFFSSSGLHILHRHASTGNRITVTRFGIEPPRLGANDSTTRKQGSSSSGWRVVKRETGILRFSKNAKHAAPATLQTIQASIPLAPMKCLQMNGTCALWKDVGGTMSSKVVLPAFALSQYQTAVEQSMRFSEDPSASALSLLLPLDKVSLPLIALRSPVEFAPTDTLFSFAGTIIVAAVGVSAEAYALSDFGLSARRILWRYFNLMEKGGPETPLPTNIEWKPIPSLIPEHNAILCCNWVYHQAGTDALQEALRAEVSHLRVEPTEMESEVETAANVITTTTMPVAPSVDNHPAATSAVKPVSSAISSSVATAPPLATTTTTTTTTSRNTSTWIVVSALVLAVALIVGWLLGQKG
jgi:hypothetical protein